MSLESPVLHDIPGADGTMRQRVREAQRALQHQDGEPLTVLAALVGYEAALNPQQYCRWAMMIKCSGPMAIACLGNDVDHARVDHASFAC